MSTSALLKLVLQDFNDVQLFTTQLVSHNSLLVLKGLALVLEEEENKQKKNRMQTYTPNDMIIEFGNVLA